MISVQFPSFMGLGLTTVAGNPYSNKQEIVSAVIEALVQKQTSKKATLIEAFAQRFFRAAALTDLLAHSIESLSALVKSAWQFSISREPDEIKVRILNPKKHSTHTVIQINCKDMPFIVDSVRMEINRYGFLVHLIIHLGGLLVQRTPRHQMAAIFPVGAYDDDGANEAVMHIEIDRQSDETLLQEMQESLVRILNDVKHSVGDWLSMRQQLHQALMSLERTTLPLDPAEIAESRDFLRWLDADHFTFLGYRDYELVGDGEHKALKIIPNSGLGVLRDDSKSKSSRHFSEMPEEARKQALSTQILIIAKTNTRSTVHRPVYTDYMGVKRFNDHGELIGESRFIGLYTSVAYSSNPRHIPFLRHKVTKVIQMSCLPPNGHAGKALSHILEVLPRDDLFQATPEELLDLSMGILNLQERQRIRLFVRKDYYGRFYSCLVFVPRERFNTDLRKKFQFILDRAFHSEETTFSTLFSDSVLARIHFVIRINSKDKIEYDVSQLEAELVAASRSWNDNFYDGLTTLYGEAKGIVCFNQYCEAFPEGYKEYYNPYTACKDVASIEKVLISNSLGMVFYRSIFKGADVLRLKLFQLNHTMPLSDVLPLLENMGLRVIGERPNEIVLENCSVWINDCDLMYRGDEAISIDAVKDNFQQAFSDIWMRYAENDGFNKLVLKANLTCRETSLLRAYAKYLQQIRFTFTQSYIEATLAKYSDITRLLVGLFEARFNPEKYKENNDRLVKRILKKLEDVAVLDEDRILRRYLDLIMATLRTNFYQTQEDGSSKPCIAIKFSPELIPDLPLPRPMFETFIYSPRVEGVHLRSSKVARGGIRWSDRREDFRVEVLGLMKAQQVKNSVIVPSGAKGGFYPKQLLTIVDRDAIFDEGKACYQLFISGLLDLADNLKEGEVIKPQSVICYDDDDCYLVVAADKGTATFSDLANAISAEYNYWLDDAFASGGSVGYDHKKMGITAKGAWESVKRHFRESFHLNTQEEDFTVAGIGDMSGDVFGNGMLLSPHIRLVAAFNHRHVFIDPKPNAEVSYEERKRLFKKPRSSWSDYDPSLLSKGGAIFSRTEKYIKLNSDIKKVLGIKKDKLTPAELIRAILCAPVDLLWNGGIGTYVKSSEERDLDVGDRVNDAVRVNGADLRCKVVGEGGNLGLTQLGRIEYSLAGGVMYTDFVDNSAGVDCSDMEVNIKILLNSVVNDKKITREERNSILAEMTDEVSRLVLIDNYRQTQAISFSKKRSIRSIDSYRRVVRRMEKEEKLNRELEFLPSNKLFFERKAKKLGLTNPEIAVLYSYAKNILKEDILSSGIPEEACFTELLQSSFPRLLRDEYFDYMDQHPLKREIISTQLANKFINRMGVNFIERVRRQTGAIVPDIMRAFVLTVRIFGLKKLWRAIESLDYQVDSGIQMHMHAQIYHLVRRSVRWLLRNHRKGIDIEAAFHIYHEPLEELKKILATGLLGYDAERYQQARENYLKHNVPDGLAEEAALIVVLFPALDIVTSSLQTQQPLKSIVNIYYRLGVFFELDWIRQQIVNKEVDNLWEETARYSLLDDLDAQQRHLSTNILLLKPARKDLSDQLEAWVTLNQDLIDRWSAIIKDLRSAGFLGFTMFMVAIRALLDIVQATHM